MTQDDQRKRLLLIDDEALIRRVIGRSVRHIFDVVEAATGEEALARIRTDELFDAVVCDVNLGGGMSGVDFARQLAVLDPWLYDSLLFLVGTPLPLEIGEELRRPMLTKPFDMGELRRLLERAGAQNGVASRPRMRTHGRRGNRIQRVLRRA